jgi:hypothetical protein
MDEQLERLIDRVRSELQQLRVDLKARLEDRNANPNIQHDVDVTVNEHIQLIDQEITEIRRSTESN